MLYRNRKEINPNYDYSTIDAELLDEHMIRASIAELVAFIPLEELAKIFTISRTVESYMVPDVMEKVIFETSINTPE